LCLHLRDLNMWCFNCQAEVQPSDSSSVAGTDDVASPSRPKVILTFLPYLVVQQISLHIEGFLV